MNHGNDSSTYDSGKRDNTEHHRNSVSSGGGHTRHGGPLSGPHHHNPSMNLGSLPSPREEPSAVESKILLLERQLETLKELIKQGRAKDVRFERRRFDAAQQSLEEKERDDTSSFDTESHEDWNYRRTDEGEIIINPFPYLEKDLKLDPEPLRLPWSDQGTRPEDWDTAKEDKHVIVVFKPLNDTSGDDSSSSNSVISQLPQSIQINSYHLATELKRIIGVSLDRKPLRLYPPFKYTSTKREDIARAVRELEEQVGDTWKERDFIPQTSSEILKPEQITELAAHIGVPAKSITTADRTQAKEVQRQRMVLKYLKVLLDVIDKDLQPLLHLRKQVAQRQIRQINFLSLWHLFSPGSIVFRGARKSDEDLPKAYRVFFVTGGRPLTHSERGRASKADSELNEVIADPDQCLPLVVDCIEIRYDRTHFGPKKRSFEIVPFEDTRDIKDLEVYPASLHERFDDIWRKLDQRGRRFRSLTQVSFKNYNGLTLDDPEEINGEVVIDWKTGWMYEERFRQGIEDMGMPAPSLIASGLGDTGWGDTGCSEDCKVCGVADHDREYDLSRYKVWLKENSATMRLYNAEKEAIPEGLYPLMPKEVLGYYLKGRSWHLLDVDLVKDNDTELDRQGFEDLVLDYRLKDLLKALVENHSVGRRASALRGEASRVGPSVHMDLVRGKGRGLIILLHGAPGVGKTLTAETIAAYTRRPLYPITCGDLGQTPGQIEKQLRHHFKLAHKWGGVLLLDEADVFLGKRDRNDVVRNGLVSVFLRELEYYSGILFLTTNQVGVLDDAFKSRIHVSLYYPNFDESSTLELWRKNLVRLRAQGQSKTLPYPVQCNEEKILRFAQQHFQQSKRSRSIWNGRQVHNAFQTAVALAEWEREKRFQEGRRLGKSDSEIKDGNVIKLKPSHFKQVSEIASRFDSYMTQIRRGKDEGEDAFDGGKRFDFEPGEHPQYNFEQDKPMKAAKSKFFDSSPAGNRRQQQQYPHTPLSPPGQQQQHYFQVQSHHGQSRYQPQFLNEPLQGHWLPQYQQQPHGKSPRNNGVGEDEWDQNRMNLPSADRTMSRSPSHDPTTSRQHTPSDDDSDDD